MTITRTDEADKITLALSGWLNTQSSPELAAAVKELPQVQSLVFDFNDLEYISSAGIREVVMAYRIQKESGRAFEIIGVNPEVMEVFRLTGILKRIPVTEKA